MKNTSRHQGPALYLCFALLAMLGTGLAEVSVADEHSQRTRDYMVVMNRPNNLNVIDLSRREVLRSCELPGGYGPGTVVVAPDGGVAYALTGRFENIYGVDIDTCDIVFSAQQSRDNERVKTMASIAVSKDGKSLYTHQNPTLIMPDRYEVQPSRIAVYDTSAGLDARPVRTLPAPRQVTIMATGEDGTLYLGGHDIYAMNPETGDTEIALASHSRNDPLESQRDVLSVWPLGAQNNEMVRMYSAARFADASGDMDTAEWIWGYERIDLATGAAHSQPYGPLEVVLFSGMARPGHPDEFYAALTQLKKFDASTQRELASVDLEHSYYCVNFASDGSELYLAGTFNDIAVYDPETLTLIDNIQLPGGDMALATAQVFPRPLP